MEFWGSITWAYSERLAHGECSHNKNKDSRLDNKFSKRWISTAHVNHVSILAYLYNKDVGGVENVDYEGAGDGIWGTQ